MHFVTFSVYSIFSIIVAVIGILLHSRIKKNPRPFGEVNHPEPINSFLKKLEPVNEFIMNLASWQFGLIVGGVYFLLQVANALLPLLFILLAVFCAALFVYSTVITKGRNLSTLVPVLIGGLVVIALIFGFFAFVGNSDERKEAHERNEIGSSIDWGDDHYWDNNTQSVQKKPW